MNSLKKLALSLEPFYAEPTLHQVSELDASKDESDDSGDLSPQLSPEEPAPVSRVALLLLLSIPHTLFIRPVLLIWLLISFPFMYFFGTDYLMLPDSPPADAASKTNIDEKTELLKQEKMLANRIKLPTASKYILPPPPRLFPLLRNPERKRRRKTLILDLDETLIHSLLRGAPRLLGNSSLCHMIELKVNNMATLYYVYKRPFCDFFLREISKWFELQIFTASVKEYADPIIDWLENDMVDHQQDGQKVFAKRYYRNDCTYRPGVGYIKDLSKFFQRSDDLRSVIILDNSPVSYALHEDNAVMIEGWINDQSDRDLLNLLPLLYSLSVCIDVRYILGMRSGEKLFENL